MPSSALRKIALAVFAVVSVVAAASAIAWALVTIRARPLDGVEGEVFFEAMRLREKRALYIDPLIGDASYGAPPTRYFVLYPPLFSAFLSVFPLDKVASCTLFARALCLACWLSSVAIASRVKLSALADSVVRSRRAFALMCAAFVLGTYVLDLFGAAGRPDALALFIATIALSRSASKGKVDAIAGVLFAVAAFTKPNVVGLGAGAMLASLLRHKRGAISGLASLVATSLAIACILHAATNGLFLPHLLTSTAQPTSLSLWRDQMASRLPFFLLPLALAGVIAFRNKKDDATFIALGALVVSFSWAILSLSKIGSASNYWMEPSLAALFVVARAPSLDLGKLTTLALVALAFQAPYNGVATFRSALLEGIANARASQMAIADIRALCMNRSHATGTDGDVVLADEPGLELELDDRAISTPFQFSHFAEKNPGFLAAWKSDVNDVHARCLVMQNDLLERAAKGEPDDPRHDRFSGPMKAALLSHFALAKTEGDLYIYVAR